MTESTETGTTPLPTLWREIGLGLALFGLYILVDLAVGESRRDEALRHGQDLLALEQWLHLDLERSLNTWLEPHAVLSMLANYEYAWTYILSALALMTWVWVRRPELWGMVRDSFVVLNLISFAIFLLYPTAPPRMLSESGFVDTVTRGRTVGSWGSGLVDSANQLAAMPSLHVGWALWVSVVLARITARRSVQLISAVHVLLTVYVVLATANHYLLDAVAVIIPVAMGVRVAERRSALERTEVVPACDAFFLHVEASGVAQNVGGLAVFASDPGRPTLEDIRHLARTELAPSRRFHQRVTQPGRWRRPRWEDSPVEVDQHVSEVHVDGEEGLRRLVADAARAELPRDRPLWRVVLVRGVGPDRSALIFLAHHAMSDGIGTVSHTLRLFRPRVELPERPGESAGALRRTGAVMVGLWHLARDGGARRLPQRSSANYAFSTVGLDLDAVRAFARVHGVRVTDVILTLVGEAVHHTHPDLADAVEGRLRTSVPITLPGPAGDRLGNNTAAVMIDLPVDTLTFAERLGAVAVQTRRLREPTRVMASRFVMATGLRLLPEPMAGWFARTVYGGRFFHAVVSNLPGPALQLTMGGTAVDQVLPLLPLAPGGAPLALGALSWGGELGFGIATDTAWLDADRLAEGIAIVAQPLTTAGGMARTSGVAKAD